MRDCQICSGRPPRLAKPIAYMAYLAAARYQTLVQPHCELVASLKLLTEFTTLDASLAAVAIFAAE